MIGVSTNAAEVAATLEARRAALSDAVAQGMRSALLKVEQLAVRNLSGGGDPWTYPVPVRMGNLRRARTVQQPEPGIGIITFLAPYATAIETGQNITQWAGRGKTKLVQKPERPFAQRAVEEAKPEQFVINAVVSVVQGGAV